MSDAVSTLAIVLRRVNHGEADRVITLLTEDTGRIAVYAKAVRKPKSKLAGGLELCMLSEISYLPSKRSGGLATVTSSRMREYYDEVVKDYELLQEAFSLLRIVDKAAEYEEDTAKIFSLTIELLRGLDQKSMPKGIVTLWFLVNLSSMLGQGLQLNKPLNTKKFEDDAKYLFDFDKMGFLEDEQGSILPADIKLLKVMRVTETPEKLKNIINLDESDKRLEGINQYLAQQLSIL